MNAPSEINKLAIPLLNEGETYICSLIIADGKTVHTILLPGDNDDASWKKQMKWAKSIGGDLPTRVEQAILFAHFKDQFKEDWYWSNTLHASYSDCAWGQGFTSGGQSLSFIHGKCRARAVRRLVI